MLRACVLIGNVSEVYWWWLGLLLGAIEDDRSIALTSDEQIWILITDRQESHPLFTQEAYVVWQCAREEKLDASSPNYLVALSPVSSWRPVIGRTL